MKIDYFVYFAIFIFAYYCLFRIYKQIIIMKYMKSFSTYFAVLQYHMEKAYDIIYKDRVLTYSLDGHRMKDEEFNSSSHDFVKLVKKLIGKRLYEQFEILYGSEDTFVFNMIEYFNSRYEGDEIRKGSIDNITDTEESIFGDKPDE